MGLSQAIILLFISIYYFDAKFKTHDSGAQGLMKEVMNLEADLNTLTSSLRHRIPHPDDIHIVGGGEVMNKGVTIIVLSLS